MIVKCPECNGDVSDKAIVCPHCGYPLQNMSPTKGVHKRKRKRLPNGFGQICKLKRNLQKPYRVMITTGFAENGKPICKLLEPVAYFKTYNEAYQALVEHNNKPYDPKSDITMQELFDLWIKDHFDLSHHDKYRTSVTSYWKKMEPFYDQRVKFVKPIELKAYLENLHVSADYKARLKYELNMLFDYAVSLEIVDRNIARNFELSTSVKNNRKAETKNHIPFTDNELKVLWSHKDDEYVSIILIQCYMGWRPQELCNITKKDIDCSEETIIGGSKTKAGINRVVPIHPCIKQLILDKYNSAKDEHVFKAYKAYRVNFHKKIKELGLNAQHSPHDCRTTFITNCKKYEVDEYAIKYMVGHAITDITEKVYTRRTLDWLKEEIKKVKAIV